jgi:DNA-nicking Smr family endonuclease
MSGDRDTDADLFLRAVGDATPLPPEARDAPPRTPPPVRPARDPDSEALADLDALVRGERPFQIVETGEHVEGRAPGVDHRTMRKLRRGQLSVQAHLDLHGMTWKEARAVVERFFEEARTEGKRCVLVVHGRGLGSKDGVPVLKSRLTAWLSRGGARRRVLAFCSALPEQGGGGATMVLLRR